MSIKFSLHYINWIYNLCFFKIKIKKLFLKTTYLKESLILNFWKVFLTIKYITKSKYLLFEWSFIFIRITFDFIFIYALQIYLLFGNLAGIMLWYPQSGIIWYKT